MEGHRQVTWSLTALAGLTWATTLYLMSTHRGALAWYHFVPALGMLAVLVAWMAALRPRRAPTLGTCSDCGTQWRADEATACPACADAA